MEHIPTAESDVQKVIRIAKVLDLSIEDAAVTCDAFHLAFSDEGIRRAIFEIVDELDRSAAKKGEPLGLIVNYTVELGLGGIRVGRYADEIPAGEMVELTPSHRANILLRIVDNFPTQEFLGPLIVNRPEALAEAECLASEAGSTDRNLNRLPSLDKEGCPRGRRGLTDTDSTRSEIPTDLPSHWPKIAIPLGPIRLKFNERFPFVSAAASNSQRTGAPSLLISASCTALNLPHHLSQWEALQAGNLAFESTSGLSPPRPSENLGHSERKMFLWPLAN
jgi:hypothetical protein